jgi:hypothetical protein
MNRQRSSISISVRRHFVDNFFYLNTILRNLPDFVISRDDKCFVVNVKGTCNIKKKEFELMPSLIELFSEENAPLIYAFCFKEKPPIFKKATEVIELYNEVTDKKWSDGVIYRSIKLEK